MNEIPEEQESSSMNDNEENTTLDAVHESMHGDGTTPMTVVSDTNMTSQGDHDETRACNQIRGKKCH